MNRDKTSTFSIGKYSERNIIYFEIHSVNHLNIQIKLWSKVSRAGL